MKTKVLIILFFIAFNSYSQNIDFKVNSFLTKSNNRKILIYSYSTGKSIKYIIKDTLEDNYFETQIIKKRDDRFEVIINSVYDVGLKVEKGWISKGDLSVAFRFSSYKKSILIYSKPNEHSSFFRINSSPESIIGIISDIMPIGNTRKYWLKVNFILNGKKKSGWLSPKNQCYNLYTMCSAE